MADPFTLGLTAIMGAVSMGATALGAATQAAGAEYAGQAQAAQANYQASVARINKQIAEENASYQRKVGEVEAQKAGLTARYNTGQTKAIQAASNLDVNFGSAKLVRDSMGQIARHDQAIVRSNAGRRAYGAEVEGWQEGAKAKLYDSAAETSRTAGRLGAFSSILGGVSSVSSKWLQQSNVGMYNSAPTMIYGPGY